MKRVMAYIGGIGSFLMILFLIVRGEMVTIQEWIAFTVFFFVLVANIYNVLANKLYKAGRE